MFAAAFFFAKTATLLWLLNKGFDIIDEGQLLMGSLHYKNYITFDYYFIVNLLFANVKFDVVNMRVLKLIVDFGAVAVLSIGIAPWIKEKANFKVHWTSLAFFCFCASYLASTPRSLSYNDVSNLLAFSIVACSFQFLTYKGGAKLVFASITGILLALQFFTKFPTSILFCLLATVLININSKSTKQGFARTAALIGSLCAAFFLLVWAYGGFNKWLQNFSASLGKHSLLDYKIIDMVVFYMTADLPLLAITLLSALTFSLFHFFLAKRKGSNEKKEAILIGSALAAFLISGVVFIVSPLEMSASLYFWYTISYALLMALPLVGNGSKLLPTKLWQGYLLLFTTPFLIVAGTNNSLQDALMGHLHTWFALIFICTIPSPPKFRRFILASLIAISSMQFLHSNIMHPFGQAENAFRQNHSLSQPEKLYLDKATESFISSLQNTLEASGMEKGHPIIQLEGAAGLVYLLNGYSPQYQFYGLGMDDFNCHHLSGITNETEKQSVVIYGVKPSEKLLACLGKSLGFPKNYKLKQVLANPYKDAIMDDYGLGYIDSFYVFAPITPSTN